jgi:hypothetical protein
MDETRLTPDSDSPEFARNDETSDIDILIQRSLSVLTPIFKVNSRVVFHQLKALQAGRDGGLGPLILAEKVYFLGESYDIDELLVEHSIDLAHAASRQPERDSYKQECLGAVEGAKSCLLTEMLGRGNIPTPSSIPTDLALRERELAIQLAVLDRESLAGMGRPQGRHKAAIAADPQYSERRQTLWHSLNEVWDQIGTYGEEAAEFVSVRRGDRPSCDDLVALAQEVGTETGLLSLFVTSKRTAMLVLLHGWETPEIWDIPVGEEGWTDLWRRFWREVHRYDGTGRRGETWQRCLLPLLLEASSYLQGVNRLVIAPHGRGHLIPWGVLLGQLDELALPVVTLPTLALLERLLRRSTVETRDTLVVGNPTDDLPYAEQEAEQVATILGCKPFIGKEATKDIVLTQLGMTRLAHFATHAYFAPGSPLDSGIVLADGVLTAREILELGLRAPEFLALSACQTGMAGSLGGDEMAGLSQALLYAGARSLLVSLWTVNDLATAHLMTGFYHRWRKEGQGKATALRDAMDATRQARPGWAHTYYWGAFTLMGDWR